MFIRSSLLVFGVALLGVALSGYRAVAQDPAWEKLRDARYQKEDDVECTAEIWGRQVKRLSRDLIEFKVKVTTKTIGRNRTGRGYATFAVVDSTGKPILTLQATKYASTGLDKKEHSESEEQEISTGADAFWKQFDEEKCRFVLTARTTAKVDFPLTTKDGVKWFKDNISPELADALDKAKKLAAGEKIEEGNWSVWSVKKGTIK